MRKRSLEGLRNVKVATSVYEANPLIVACKHGARSMVLEYVGSSIEYEEVLRLCKTDRYGNALNNCRFTVYMGLV